MARNVAKAGAAKGGSCKGVFQARVKDAIRLRNMIETLFGNRRGQENGEFKGWKLERLIGDRHGQERGKSRCGKGWKLQRRPG